MDHSSVMPATEAAPACPGAEWAHQAARLPESCGLAVLQPACKGVGRGSCHIQGGWATQINCLTSYSKQYSTQAIPVSDQLPTQLRIALALLLTRCALLPNIPRAEPNALVLVVSFLFLPLLLIHFSLFPLSLPTHPRMQNPMLLS
jgi:hypothetical protein